MAKMLMVPIHLDALCLNQNAFGVAPFVAHELQSSSKTGVDITSIPNFSSLSLRIWKNPNCQQILLSLKSKLIPANWSAK